MKYNILRAVITGTRRRWNAAKVVTVSDYGEERVVPDSTRVFERFPFSARQRIIRAVIVVTATIEKGYYNC